LFIAWPMGNSRDCGGYTPMMPIVPALATAWVSHSSACDGAPPGPPSPGGSASTPTASITRSGPMPPVSSAMACTGSSASKSMTSALCRLAASSREGTWSTARMANCPTGPQPNTATTWRLD
jgi:hypothetical protein